MPRSNGLVLEMLEKNSYKEILGNIEQGNYAPLYWLEGEEPFFIDQIVAAIRTHAIPEQARTFNEWVIYGKETTLEQLVTHAKQYPIGGERKLYIVRQAQEISSWRQKESVTRFTEYIQHPAPFTLLVFCVTTQPKSAFLQNKNLRTLLKKYAVYFQSKKLYETQLPDWISKHAASKGYTLTHKATALLAESIGNDLPSLANELDKLMLSYPKNMTIDAHHIEQQVGISREFNFFELQKALGTKQKGKVHQIVDYLVHAARTPTVLIINLLFQYFLKLAQLQATKHTATDAQLATHIGVHPYFLKEYRAATTRYSAQTVWRNVQLIQIADLRMKGLYGYNPQSSALLKELAYRLMQ